MPYRESETERQQREFISTARTLMKIEEVKLHHFPKWLHKPTKLAAKTLGVKPMEYATGSHELMDLFRRSVDALGGDGSIDHWGSFRTKERDYFVSEPYSAGGDWLTAWEKFAELAGIEFRFSASSWWFPGSTTRLALWIPRSNSTERVNLTKPVT